MLSPSSAISHVGMPRCDEGNAHVCENGSIFASTGTEPLPRFLPYLPSTLDTSQRVLTLDTLPFRIRATPFTLTGGPVEGATVAVHGLGPIGLFAVNAAKAKGATTVIAVDWDNTYRMNLAGVGG